METSECIICTEPIYYTVLLPCNHASMCIKCLQTLMVCEKQRSCPYCQHEFEKDPIITDNRTPKPYEEEVKLGYKHSNKFHVFYKDDDVLNIMENNLKYQCPDCGKYYTNKKEFTQHLSTHKLVMCNVCSRSQRFLKIDIPIFSKRDIGLHTKQHPRCIVCPYQAFDQNDLNKHMNDTHIRCPICAKHDKIVWFATPESIIQHNKEKHYVCEAPECISQPNVAFDSQLELQFHQISVHGHKIPSTIRPKETFDDENEKQSWKKDQEAARKRHMDACRALALKANEEFHGNKKRIGRLLQNIDLLDDSKITPNEFLTNYHKICGDLAEILFCNTVSAIGNPDARATVVRIKEGYRLGKGLNDKTSASPKSAAEQFPTFDQAYSKK